MKRFQSFGWLMGLMGVAGLWTGCALPHGSFARPATPVAEGKSLMAAGAMVPFYTGGAADVGNADVSFGGLADNFTIIPALSYDYALGDAEYFGVEVALTKSFASVGSSAFGIFVNPRYEMGFGGKDRDLALTLDINGGYFTDGNTGVPFFSPTLGVRYYVPLGPIGFVLSQQIGTGFVTVILPGSFAIDINLGAVHIFPEIRWDPTIWFAGVSGIIATLSAGGTIMFEL